MSNLGALRGAILKLEPCEDAAHVSTVPVKEVFQGKTVWEGEVEVFRLVGHPKAERCYAWAYQDDAGKTHYTVVLKVPPIKSPQDAVKAAIRAKAPYERKET